MATAHPLPPPQPSRALPETRCLPRATRRGLLLGLIVIHCTLLGWSAWRDTYTIDEPRHLAAGLSHWELGTFVLFRANPPLVRLVAALPVLMANPGLDWSDYTASIYVQGEVECGSAFVERNGSRSFWLLTLARWTCIPFSVLGMLVCYCWARDLFGDAAGLLAATLWAFEPNVLAHGRLITADMGAAALGVTTLYAFRCWLLRPDAIRTAATAAALGLALLTKSTWIILFALLPGLWVLWRIADRRDGRSRRWRTEGIGLVAILVGGLFVLNAGYGFEGTLTKLGSYEFRSTGLGGDQARGEAGNRYSGTLLGGIRVPLPANYIQGLDQMRYFLAQPDWSYLAGEWRDQGWYYYYVCAMMLKVPLGMWVLGYAAAFLACVRKDYALPGREELLLLIPGLAMLILVSSQTGFNRHLRYVLPLFPFAMIFISRVARAATLGERGVMALSGVALVWSIMSSLMVYPHSLSYFNELGGGPRGGHAYLLGSNIEWGQDGGYLKRWYDAHPEARPLHWAHHGRDVTPGISGIGFSRVPSTPTPGWHAVSVIQLRSRSGRLAYFLRAEPVATAGYSIYIYHLTAQDCESLRLAE